MGADHPTVAVTADGRRALASSGRGLADNELRLWDLDTGRCQQVIAIPAGVRAMWLSADGRTVVVASEDHAIRAWDLTTGRCTRMVTAHVGLITTLSVSGDARLALSGDDSAVRLWDLDGGRCLRTFRGHRSKVGCVLLGPDGQSGLSAGGDNAVRWWAWRLPHSFAGPPQLSRPRRPAELTRLGDSVDALVSEANQAMSAGRYASALGLLTRARAIAGYERAPRVLSAWRALGRSTVRVGLRAGWTTKVFVEPVKASTHWGPDLPLTREQAALTCFTADEFPGLMPS